MILSNPYYLKTDIAKFEVNTTHSDRVLMFDAICHHDNLESTINDLLQNVQPIDQELNICVHDTITCEGIPVTYVYSVQVNAKALQEIPFMDAAFEIGKRLKFKPFTE